MPQSESRDKCLTFISNQYDLTLVAAYRARQLARGATPKIRVAKGSEELVLTIALQEIAAGLVGYEMLNKTNAP